MSTDKVDTVRSSSSGRVGRAISRARGQELVLDSSSHPNDDAFTNSEAFLAGISSCGVTLIEGYAEGEGIPVERLEVTVEGVRPVAEPSRFSRVAVHFAFTGVTRSQAGDLVRIWRER